MDISRALEKLKIEWEDFFRAAEDFFSPGWDKYNSYSSFSENFTADFNLENGFTGEIENKTDLFEKESKEENNEFFDNEDEFKAYVRRYRKTGFFYPGIEVRRVPAHQLGYGVLGRCFPYSGIIEIRQDLYGDEFSEVLTHELTHMANPHWGELDVRMATRMKLPFTPRWH